jgi:phage terminase large subunit
LRLFWDIGGAGAKADAMAIWVVQWAGQEIRVLDFLEGQGQVLGYYTNELRHRGYGKSLCYFPHRIAYSSVAGEYFGDSVLILSWQLWDFHSD